MEATSEPGLCTLSEYDSKHHIYGTGSSSESG